MIRIVLIATQDSNTVAKAKMKAQEPPKRATPSATRSPKVSCSSATAVDEVEAYSLSREEFLGLLRRRADVALDVMAALARRFRKTDELLRRKVPNPNEVADEQETFGDRVADGVARFGGSWAFIFSFAAILLSWVAINTILIMGKEAFDPYPFILLNLFLSMLAAIQAPVIMMSQNRQDARDRIRSELDYQVNLKAELEIMQLHDKFDRLREELLARERGPSVS